MTKPNEKLWWYDEMYWKKVYLPELGTSLEPRLHEIVEEATRRGERKAWEELKEYCEEERARCNRKMDEYKKDGKFGLQRQMDGEAVVHYIIARVLGDRLSSLNNSSKE